MKFLIAGLGSIGRRHLRNLLKLGERDILLYRTHHSTLPDLEISSFPVETDLETALAHKPGVVIVSNPTALHLDVAIPAAEEGCHLFIEKPLSNSLERIDKLQAAVKRGKGSVFCGYQYRFHPGLGQIKQLLSNNAIGKPISVRAHWGEYLPGWHPWEDFRRGYSARADLGGGVVLTLSHPLDYLRWLFGEVSEVWSLTSRLTDLNIEVEDTAEIGLRFSSGILGSVHLDYIQRPASHRLDIIGAQGTIKWDSKDGTTRIYRADLENWESLTIPEGYQRNDLFLAEMEHFLQVVNSKSEPLCSLEDGIQALRMAMAIHESHSKLQIIKLS